MLSEMPRLVTFHQAVVSGAAKIICNPRWAVDIENPGRNRTIITYWNCPLLFAKDALFKSATFIPTSPKPWKSLLGIHTWHAWNVTLWLTCSFTNQTASSRFCALTASHCSFARYYTKIDHLTAYILHVPLYNLTTANLKPVWASFQFDHVMFCIKRAATLRK
jgi:hypothetical protein